MLRPLKTARKMHCRVRILLFSSHDLKAQVSFSDRLLTVGRLGVRMSVS